METYIVDWDLDPTLSSFKLRMKDCLENSIVSRLGQCQNLNFLGWAEGDANSHYAEAVFQIKDYDTIFLRICKDNKSTGDVGINANLPTIRLSSSPSLTTVNSYLSLGSSVTYGGEPSTFLSFESIGSASQATNAKFNFWMVTKDEGNNSGIKNLQVLWQPKAPNATNAKSQGIFLGTTESNRDYIAVMCNGNNMIRIFYLDDGEYTNYSIPVDSVGYTETLKALKMNWMPITMNNSLANTVDNCEDDYVKIFNSNLGTVDSDKNSSEVRKLIQIGNDYYRQIVGCYWIKDPKGDETPQKIINDLSSV